MKISLIVSMGKNGEIGSKNGLLWKLSSDLKRFKEITTGNTIVMGRKTYESIGKPLPNRKNVVITRNKNFRAPGVVIVSSLKEAFKKIPRDGEVFVIGGGEIYTVALPYVNKLYITHVNATLAADTYFPKFDKSEWQLISSEKHKKDDKNEYSFSFNIYERKKHDLVDTTYAKGGKYQKIIKEIKSLEVCPFCPETFKWHTKPILKNEGDWFITENFNPYKTAKHHLLIISKTHHENLSELKLEDFKSVMNLANWGIKKFSIEGGGITLRFGNTKFTGATIRHLHFHVLTPKFKNGKVDPVFFPIG